MLLAEVERVLRAHAILRAGEERVVVACSGGRDSMVLAHAAAELLGARRVILGHVDHATRAGSSADAKFVADSAAALGASFAVETLEPGPADEARLRRLRYAALEKIRRDFGAALVLTAHTLEDQAETVLLALIRSARPEALRGIKSSHRRVVRPMLSVSRSEVVEYALDRALGHREDPTNREPRYLRNRVRKELLPLLETRYRANMAKRLARLAGLMSGGRIESAAKARVRVERTPTRSGHSISMERQVWAGQAIPDGKQVAIFDADVLQRPVVRAAREGDRIQPFGMEGHRKVRDLLRETRIPVSARGSFFVVTDESDEVVWVPGAARSGAYPVTPSTQHVWVFRTDDSDKLQQTPRGVTVEEQDQDE